MKPGFVLIELLFDHLELLFNFGADLSFAVLTRS